MGILPAEWNLSFSSPSSEAGPLRAVRLLSEKCHTDKKMKYIRKILNFLLAVICGLVTFLRWDIIETNGAVEPHIKSSCK